MTFIVIGVNEEFLMTHGYNAVSVSPLSLLKNLIKTTFTEVLLIYNVVLISWQPTPVFLPGESQGWRSMVDCRLWGCTESDMTEAT